MKVIPQSKQRKTTKELSGVVVNSSGDLQANPKIKIEQQRRLVSIGTVVLALVNISIEATLQILEVVGKVDHRGGILSTVGVVLVAICFFTIPIRNKWTMKLNAVILVLCIGYCIVHL
jgi:hypothetical protein